MWWGVEATGLEHKFWGSMELPIGDISAGRAMKTLCTIVGEVSEAHAFPLFFLRLLSVAPTLSFTI